MKKLRQLFLNPTFILAFSSITVAFDTKESFSAIMRQELQEDKLLPEEGLDYVLLFDTFEKETLDPNWLGDRQSFDTSSGSLRLEGPYLSPVYLAHRSNRLHNTVWEVGIQVAPALTNTNFVRIYLASNSPNIKQPHKSYQLEIRGENTLHYYQLWHQEGNARRLLFQSHNLTNQSNLFRARIRAVCDTNGLWTLWADEYDGGNFVIITGDSDSTLLHDEELYYGTHYLALQFHYTPTKQKDFRMDYFLQRQLEEDPPPPEPIQAEEVIINEILSNPNIGGVEFVELYNRSGRALDLRQLFLARKVNGVLAQQRPLSRTALVLGPAAFKVLSADGERVRQHYYAPDPAAFQDMEMPQINNNEGHIVLMRADSLVIDQIQYHPGLHSPFIRNARGVSLERKNVDIPTPVPENWTSASSQVGYATPGYKNSQSSEEISPTKVWLESKTMSPDNDGLEDQLEVHYTFDRDGVMANIVIYNDKGLVVKRLLQAYNLGREGTFHWDGMVDGSERAKTGIYIMHIEAYHASGWRKTFKLNFVVAYRDY